MRLGDILITFGIFSIILSAILIPLDNIGVQIVEPAVMSEYKNNLEGNHSLFFAREGSEISKFEEDLADPESKLIDKKDPGAGTFGVYDASLLFLAQIINTLQSLLHGPFIMLHIIHSIINLALSDIPILRDFALIAYQIISYVMFIGILFAIIRFIFGRDDKL
jgi:hypothetical protein